MVTKYVNIYHTAHILATAHVTGQWQNVKAAN